MISRSILAVAFAALAAQAQESGEVAFLQNDEGHYYIAGVNKAGETYTSFINPNTSEVEVYVHLAVTLDLFLLTDDSHSESTAIAVIKGASEALSIQYLIENELDIVDEIPEEVLNSVINLFGVIEHDAVNEVVSALREDGL